MEFRGEGSILVFKYPRRVSGGAGELRIDRDINKFVYTLNKTGKPHYENRYNRQYIK